MNANIVNEQYKILNSKKKEASFYKVDLHIHTPGSRNDYKINNKLYEKVDKVEIEKIASEKGLYKCDEIKKLDLSKDELTAILIVHEACTIKSLNLIVITDHNSIEWYKNISKAAEIYYELYPVKNKQFNVLPGVEITCFSGTHIIGILDPDQYDEHWRYIKYSLNAVKKCNKEVFTSKSEIDVIETIKSVGGIVYIPHLDNNSAKVRLSDMLTPLSGSSKAELLTNVNVDAIGFTDYSKKYIIQETLEDKKSIYYREKYLSYMQDSDAHDIDEIGIKPMYVKMEKPNFNSLKFGLSDPKTRVRKDLLIEKELLSFVEGVVTSGGYLSKPNCKWNYYPFSKGLNCIIGSRGSGKSTLIKIINSCVKGRVSEAEFREFISEYDSVLVFIYQNGFHYCITLNPEVYKDSYTNLAVNKYGNPIGRKNRDIKEWLNIYKLIKNQWKRIKETDNLKTLREIYMDFYEQSEIYEIGTKENVMNNFIEELLERRDRTGEYIKLKKELKEEISLLNRFPSLDNRNIERFKIDMIKIDDIKKQINNYKKNLFNQLNKSLNNKVNFKYTEYKYNLNQMLQDELYSLVDEYSKKDRDNTDRISCVIEYLASKYTIFEIIIKCRINVRDLSHEIEKSKVIYIEKESDIEQNINYSEIIDKIEVICLKCLKTRYINRNELYVNIEFNVNSYEGGNRKVVFKDLNVLSYGQRAVAIMAIISEGITDSRVNIPLIIDQPEDQLDNRFIFKHLVTNIRELKEKRQIILVTHNPNIPVSGDAENIICLTSDNENGWIDSYGALDNRSIQNNIINVMEGGEDSFKMRIRKYSHVDLR